MGLWTWAEWAEKAHKKSTRKLQRQLETFKLWQQGGGSHKGLPVTLRSQEVRLPAHGRWADVEDSEEAPLPWFKAAKVTYETWAVDQKQLETAVERITAILKAPRRFRRIFWFSSGFRVSLDYWVQALYVVVYWGAASWIQGPGLLSATLFTVITNRICVV